MGAAAPGRVKPENDGGRPFPLCNKGNPLRVNPEKKQNFLKNLKKNVDKKEKRYSISVMRVTTTSHGRSPALPLRGLSALAQAEGAQTTPLARKPQAASRKPHYQAPAVLL
jgi:hypothetical protein